MRPAHFSATLSSGLLKTQTATTSTCLANWHQVALVVVRAVNAEEINLASIATMFVTGLAAMNAASLKLNATVFDAPGFALNAVNPRVVLHEQVGPAVTVTERHPNALLLRHERGNDLHRRYFTCASGVSHTMENWKLKVPRCPPEIVEPARD